MYLNCLHICLVHISRIDGETNDLQCLNLEPNKPRFCIFSIAFSNCGKQIISGSSDCCLYIYDRTIGKRTLKIPVVSIFLIQMNVFFCIFNGLILLLNKARNHSESDDNNDVNTVGFIDDTSNIIYTGLDDGIIRVNRICLF